MGFSKSKQYNTINDIALFRDIACAFSKIYNYLSKLYIVNGIFGDMAKLVNAQWNISFSVI